MRSLLKLFLIIVALVFTFYLVLAPLLMVFGLALPHFTRITAPPLATGVPYSNWYATGLFSAPVLIVLMAFIFIFAFAVIVLKTVVRGSNGGGRAMEPDETRMMQEIYHGLSRMEKRVEALETILLDRARRSDVLERGNTRRQKVLDEL